jgi:ParB family chromosome partitioning protein
MPSTTDTPRAPSANKKRLGALVAQTVKVLDRPVSPDEAPVSALERNGVRSKLRLNRASGLLALDTIRPDPNQPRKIETSSEEFRDLVESVKAHGVLQPITVRHVEDGDYFQIVAGERRYHAALAAGLLEISAVVKDIDDTVTAVQQIEENLHRKNLNPLEEAAAIRRLMSATSETQEQVARRIHKSPAYVSRVLTIEEQLTRQEKTDLAKLAPAQAPGISLIHTALQTSDPKMRAAILSGGLKRAEARQAVAATKGKPLIGRPKTYSRTFRAAAIAAIVTVRFEKKKNASREDVLDALDAARAEIKREQRES